jgi:hypothetical protein
MAIAWLCGCGCVACLVVVGRGIPTVSLQTSCIHKWLETLGKRGHVSLCLCLGVCVCVRVFPQLGPGLARLYVYLVACLNVLCVFVRVCVCVCVCLPAFRQVSESVCCRCCCRVVLCVLC